MNRVGRIMWGFGVFVVAFGVTIVAMILMNQLL